MAACATKPAEASSRTGQSRENSRRKARALFGALAVLALAGAQQGYVHWRIGHLEAQAENFRNQRDLASTVVVCRRLLELNPNDAAACRMMAEIAQLAGSVDAVGWYQRLLTVQPDTVNRLAFAMAALAQGQEKPAHDALGKIPPGDRESRRFHEVAGALAVAEKKNEEAEEHFRRAAQLAPNDPRPQLNLALIELAARGLNSGSARANLARLVANPAVRLAALRALLGDAVARRETETAAQWSEQLHATAGATFADKILCLETSAQNKNAETWLAELQATAQNSPAETAALVSWMSRRGEAPAAISWANSLAEKITRAQPAPLAIAEAYSCAEDWNGLANFVRGANWGDCESLRLAVEGHALRRLEKNGERTLEFETTWRSALKLAQARPEQLRAIADLASGWGYANEAEETWWMMANGSGNAQPALEKLNRIYTSNRNTLGLLKVAKRAFELNPGDLVAANNCASLALLFGRDASAERLAEKLHSEHPAVAEFTATYAFALHTAGKTPEALKVLATLPDAQLRQPAIAAYYLVMLVQNGELERAMSFLPAAKRANLLPEEQQLVGHATRTLLERARAEAAVAQS